MFECDVPLKKKRPCLIGMSPLAYLRSENKIDSSCSMCFIFIF